MMKGRIHNVKCVLRLQDDYPFVHELGTRISHALELGMQSAEYIQLSESGVHEFIKFMHPVKCAIRYQEAFGSLDNFLFSVQDEVERFEIKVVHRVLVTCW
ncbi:hypothetical protein EJD97_014375 [Solanum chilense]|uniref:Uncharacterized protein n=1 Tax=Solanum chilense TaxID=4083 RepID=A0A6N2C7V6_SOLCI|nr:hypothetical protein EJD97_014375 [Solanum chilense]